ncbi:hypothetical protein [Micromonospora psammae]|uniref:hypothetical protein n=1 Tax=Micromonospora sp. CPCC 205556 TaxID=3122398 RepID=UPI002FF421CA
MEPTDLLPTDSGIVVYQCRACGGQRVCRAGWRTRCHICLDDRSSGVTVAGGERLLSQLSADPELAAQVRQFADVPEDGIVSVPVAAEFRAAIALERELDRHRHDGWTVMAGDVHGLPWYGERLQPTSHGTWAVHDRCGTPQKVPPTRPACGQCPPEQGSRLFAALRDTPYLLYLVRHRGLQKFGVGGDARVRAHLAAGAELVSVREGRHSDVIAAEAILKRQKRAAAVPLRFWRTRRMPVTFGAGTEIVRATTPVDLVEVLPAGVDVTHRFVSADPIR